MILALFELRIGSMVDLKLNMRKLKRTGVKNDMFLFLGFSILRIVPTSLDCVQCSRG